MYTVVYKARDVIILMWANPLRWPLEGVGPENQDFFGPKKSIFPGPTPSNSSMVMDLLPKKIIKSKRHIKKQVHW